MDKRLKMPLGLAQFAVKFTYQGQDCRNVLYFQRKGHDPITGDADPMAWTDDTAVEMTNNIAGAYESNYAAAMSNLAQIYGVDWCWNEAVDTGPLHIGSDDGTGLPVNGTNSGEAAPANVTLAIKLATGLGGRSRHGRFYFVGINAGLYVSGAPSKLKDASITDFGTNNAGFLNDVNVVHGTGGPPTEWIPKLSVASFVVGGGLRPAGALVTNVTQLALHDANFDSQRRRLIGRGQ